MSREYIEKKSETALSSMFRFSGFVAETEFLASATCVEFQEKYGRAWFDMEVVNALALAEWEQDSSPEEWSKIWVEKYRNEAEETLFEFLEVVKEWPVQ
ncbi:hypothetical protein [Vreelandella olivaria]|uniref:hypothetical protein n=1 Tax=Vreelandella olivaria TaxID=390919 RepID=UPI00201FA240|nr:hypothetical protein [Halomonas olivaria]